MTSMLRARLRLCLLTLSALFCLLRPASASTLTVPAQYATIQAAINASVSGDTVLIADGTYTGPGNVDLDFGGKNITVTSADGAASTVIDCQGSSNANHRGFYLHSGETTAVINGLTIQNGYEDNGGGAHDGFGGGIYNSGVGVTVQDCIIKGNTADYGGGIANSNGAPIAIINCVIAGNAAVTDGGGINNTNSSGGTVTVTNCTVTGNGANIVTPGNNFGGGIYNGSSNGSTFTLTNDIVYGDTNGDVLSYSDSSSVAAATHCDILGGLPLRMTDGGGNVSADPLLVNAPYDFHPQPGSPVVGAGTSQGAPATDLGGSRRSNPPSIGAYEAVPAAVTGTTLTSSLNPSPFGRTITFTAAVMGAGGTPTGNVTFTLDGASQPPAALAGGSAAFVAPSLSVGPHTVTAAYSGGPGYVASASATLTQTVIANANPQYVSPSGSDGSAGTAASPKLTIQAAISAASSGGTVIVEDGTYTGPGDVDLDSGGRNITVQSQNGPTSTIIDCGGSANAPHRGFYLHSGETRAVISGLTVKNGSEVGYGGGATGYGGGIYSSGVGLAVQNCILKNNTASNGGGLCAFVGLISVTNCVFSGNSAGAGAAIYGVSSNGTPFTVTNCTITGNTSAYGGCLYNGYPYGGSSTSTLTNDILYGDTGGEIASGGNYPSSAVATHCDIQGGVPSGTMDGGGNINADPLLLAPLDLRLRPGSPCLGAGTAAGAPTTTIDGRTRPNPPSIGAYEGATIGTTATTTTLVSSLNPSGSGQSVTFTATVAGSGGTPMEAVTFTIDGIAEPAVTLSGGAAAYSTSSLPIGSHTVTAAYTGDANFAPSMSPALTQTVTLSSTSTILASSLNPSGLGQQITLTAAVTGNSPTGTVTFTDTTGGAVLGTAALSRGTATLTTYNLMGGSHQITASYGGDGSNLPSTSPALMQTVNQAGTGVYLSSYPNPSSSGQSVTFMATVVGVRLMPTGTVTFIVDGIAQPPVALPSQNNGFNENLAIYSTSSLSIGSHTITATYNGDVNFTPSASTALTQTVTPPVTSLAVANLPGTPGQTLTLSATLTQTGGAGLAGRTLTFRVDGAAVGTAVTGGTGTASLRYVVPASTAGGLHTLTASFAGDGGGAASSGTGALAVTLNTVVVVGVRLGKAGTATLLKSTLKSAAGVALAGRTLSYTVNGVAAGSAVTDATGLASLSYAVPSSAASGGEPIVVTFGGDVGDRAGSGKGTLTVSH